MKKFSAMYISIILYLSTNQNSLVPKYVDNDKLGSNFKMKILLHFMKAGSRTVIV